MSQPDLERGKCWLTETGTTSRRAFDFLGAPPYCSCVVQIDKFSIIAGYLMTSRPILNRPMTYECVDGKPEYIEGMEEDVETQGFYWLKFACYGGKVFCPGYNQDNMLTCAVCSK